MSKEAAIMFYNATLSILNAIVDIYELIDDNIPEVFIAEVVGIISLKVAAILSLMPTALKVILAIADVAFALIASSISYFGYHKQGFYIGFLRNGFLNWDFVCGTME